ncbi:YihY/virulence factor BrkB family protein [Nocardioides euryhalodurans]|uniref:YihY/virulence factor BrkB family protein n=2 Tax=Nocardioides euryhalodurans TaxID=2518370 RepID=A0A4P7GR95_9ACTN|nr:YihY/virulence factor BrkB family protein [Nocardioides euryhalodurans]
MVDHYGTVRGSLQAGAVTYFAFLSFFPVLALGFFVVGQVSKLFDGADDALAEALEQLLPGIVGDDPGEMSVETFQSAAAVAGIIGLVGVVYAGLGWLSAMREALVVVFELPQREQPNFVLGKLRDLVSLAVIGTTLVLSVAVTGFVSGFAGDLLAWIGLDQELAPLLELMTYVLGFGANMLLFFTLFKLLAQPHAPNRALWGGALLGAVGFEVLKRISFLLLAATQESEAFQVFGIALILLVWINYFSRVVMYAAAWAHTAPEARAVRDREALDADRSDLAMKELAHVQLRETPEGGHGSRVDPKVAFAAGGASMLGLVALVRRRKEKP